MKSGEQIEVSHLELNSMALYDLCLFGIINGHLNSITSIKFQLSVFIHYDVLFFGSVLLSGSSYKPRAHYYKQVLQSGKVGSIFITNIYFQTVAEGQRLLCRDY